MLSAKICGDDDLSKFNDASKRKPLDMSEICSTVIDPQPCSISPTRFELLARKYKRDGKLVYARSHYELEDKLKLDYLGKGSGTTLRNLGLKILSNTMVWKEWNIGEEYCKNFIIKNINSTSTKITYEAPSTLFFSTLFSPLIFLAAGTTFELPITFKPLQKENYYDQIKFTTLNGSFILDLQGLLPQHCVHIPKNIYFGVSAVKVIAELRFEVKNLSELSTTFFWNVSKPFQIVPSQGILHPKSSTTMQASFFPSFAGLFDALAVFQYGKNLQSYINLNGIGKYPYILMSCKQNLNKCDYKQQVLNFKNVLFNQKTSKKIFLHNVSNVQATYTVSLLTKMKQLYSPFVIKKTTGLLASMDKESLPIFYMPCIPYQNDIAYVEVEIAGNVSKSIFKCIGYCEGPKVIASFSLINFGVLNPEQNTSIISFDLINQSNSDAVFQFDLDENYGVFCVDISSGKLTHYQSQKIKVSFDPPFPGIYYRRAVLLVHEQGPIFIDLIGTKHSMECEPAFLLPEHLEYYKILLSRNLSIYPPHIVQQQIKEGKLDSDVYGYPMLPDQKQVPITSFSNTDEMTEYFDDGYSTDTTVNVPHVSLDKRYVWMGEVVFGEKKIAWTTSITVFNHTYGKVVATWIPDATALFHVFPAICEILPLKSKKFLISFTPDACNQVYKRQLECYVSYKCLRNYRIVKNKFVVPPWLLLVDIVGHTFNGNKSVFYPQANFSNENIIFAPVQLHFSSFRTICIENNGIIPILYRFIQDKSFICVKPPFNATTSKYQISVVRFIPKTVGFMKDKLIAQCNDNQMHNKTFHLAGLGDQPEILMSNEGRLYIKPTCLYSTSTEEYQVQNICQLSVQYKWVIPKHYTKTFIIEPSQGYFLANEIQKFSCTFMPNECNDYCFNVHFYAWCVQKNCSHDPYVEKSTKKIKLQVITKGLKGVIRTEISCIDFGCLLVGSKKMDQLLLYNDFNCDLYFELSLKQVIDNEYGEETNSDEPMGLNLNTQHLVVPARNQIKIELFVQTYRPASYNWYIYYSQITSSGDPIPTSQQMLLCHITADAVYPLLKVIDARPGNNCRNMTRGQLWNWFNLNNFNKFLDCDPEKIEIAHSASTKKKSYVKANIYTKSIVDFNFGAAPLEADELCVYIILQNIGLVPCSWFFFFPKDLEMELEPWAVEGMHSSEEVHVSHVQANELFTVFPKEGYLDCDETCQVRFCYKHDFIGTHRIPVLFKIEHGKEVSLQFVGVTVEPERRYLHFVTDKHCFDPVALDDRHPPVQLYELFNGGSNDVVYNVELSNLSKLKADNFEHPILTCINPLGLIPSQCSLFLELIFSPLENKTYTVDLPIHIADGPTAVVQFTGAGFDSRIMGKSMSYSDVQLPEVPSKDTEKLRIPSEIISLSSKSINFGNVPLYARARKILFVTNISNRPLSFSWFGTCPAANKVLQFNPHQGRIDPGQTIMFRITFCAGGRPSFYNLNLICEVVDLVKVARYKEELEAWESEQARQNVEFCITSPTAEKNKSPCRADEAFLVRTSCKSKPKNLEKRLNPEPESPRLLERASTDKVKIKFKEFHTLLPIKVEKAYDSNQAYADVKFSKYHCSRKDEWVRPLEPRPSVTHLTVTARTHNICEFHRLFASENNKHFIDKLRLNCRLMQADMGEEEVVRVQSEFLSSSNDFEKTMLVLILNQVVRSILDDPAFYDAMCELSQTPPPYFAELPVNRVSAVAAEQEASPMSTDSLYEPDPFATSIRREDAAAPTESAVLVQLKNKIKSNSYFASMLEEFLATVVGNIMEEALYGEVLLTVRPRVIALPPRRMPDRSSMAFLNVI